MNYSIETLEALITDLDAQWHNAVRVLHDAQDRITRLRDWIQSARKVLQALRTRQD
jgi:hypothetical protein